MTSRRSTTERLENILREVDILYGIALEIIISAAHLEIDTEGYVSDLTADNLTPHISVSKKKLLKDLEGELAGEKVRQIDLVLQLAKKKRDNLVHFGFHYQGAHLYNSLFVDVAGFLICRYAGTDDIPELESIAKYREAQERRRSGAETFPEVDVGVQS